VQALKEKLAEYITGKHDPQGKSAAVGGDPNAIKNRRRPERST